MELSIPVIALAQLSRNVEGREDKRPLLSDLRESGSIEQDADLVAFLYRDDYYTKQVSENPYVSESEFIIAKHRNGPTCTINLLFQRNTSTFVNMVKREGERALTYEEYSALSPKERKEALKGISLEESKFYIDEERRADAEHIFKTLDTSPIKSLLGALLIISIAFVLMLFMPDLLTLINGAIAKK